MTVPTSPLLSDAEPKSAGDAASALAQLRRPSRLGLALLGVLALIFAAGVVSVMDQVAPSLPLALVGGVGLMALVSLAIGRYEVAVAFGFLMSGVVKIEPAPPDGVFAVIIAIAIVTGRLRVDRVPAPVAFLLAGLSALSVFSFAEAFSVGYGIRFVAITFYLFVFSVWLAGYADRDRRGRQIVIAWLTIAIISAFLGTLALQFPGFPMRLEFIADGASRGSALFKDPNVYGPFLVPIAVILLEELIAPRLLRIGIITGLTLFAILIVGLIFSFSRAAWANMLISSAVMLAILLLRRRNTLRLLGVLGGLGVVGMVVLGIVVFGGQAEFIGQRAQLQGYDSERFGAQRAGIQIASQHPLGVGPGQFQFHYPVETHSTYVRVLAEQGPFGLALWVSLCLVTLGLAIANAFAGRSAGGIGSAALLGAWCGLLVNSAVVDTLHWRHLWAVAGLIWAASMVGERRERHNQRTLARRDAERKAAIAARRPSGQAGATDGSDDEPLFGESGYRPAAGL
ncbi:MAG: O-antigen ligase family protein [Solirubrobacteraceae bacterium]|nr:O-antigen ligase family protein [Solirubrobacteraceae bacterium]